MEERILAPMSATPNVPNEVSREDLCTCKNCNHDLARDCAKSKCQCCSKSSHSMVIDGIEGFPPVDREDTT